MLSSAATPYSGLLNVLDTTTFDSEEDFMAKYGDLKQAEEVRCVRGEGERVYIHPKGAQKGDERA